MQKHWSDTPIYEDIKKLDSIGVGKLFTPGTSIEESKQYIQDWVKQNRS